MRFLFRSHWGEVLPVALRVQAEGNDVQIFIGAKEAKEVGDGLVRKAVDLGKAVQWADVVVYESNVYELPDEAEKVRSVRPVIGSSKLAGRLENNRMAAIEEARKVGLTIGDPVKHFSGPNAWLQARRFLESADQDQAFVWKPDGEAPVQTYVADDLAELDRLLAYWRELFIRHHQEPSFILTPRISGVEVSTEGWFDGNKFSFLNHTIERNRLMAGDVGEKTGCQGNVVWLAPNSNLANQLIRPLASLLQGQYRGPVDVNAIIDEKSNQPTFLEFTPRFGYDAIFTFMMLVKDVGKTLADCAMGKLSSAEVEDDGRFAASYRITIPPFPEEPAKKDESKPVGVPVFGLDTDTQDSHFSLIEVKVNSDEELETSGPGGLVMTVNEVGNSPEDAMRKAFKRGEKIHISNMRYRVDLAESIQGVYDDLVATKWLSSSLPEGGGSTVSLFGRAIRKSPVMGRGFWE